MAKPDKDAARRPSARLPKGMRDIGPDELRQTQAMLDTIRKVYERYGFEPLETPAFEYTDALGKFLPDSDRPNEGVFSFQDVVPEAREGKDEQWLSLRYDLTAPLARYYAENADKLPKPFRRYATGSVYRNEKPGPGRFRQFTQFDADTVGADSVAADAEMCMLAADTLEALGIPRGQYVIKVNNRKILDGVMEAIGVAGSENASKRLAVLRAIDKLDKFSWDDVSKLLGGGRKDDSGDFTPGANLDSTQIYDLKRFLDFSTRIAEAYFPDAARFLVSEPELAEQQYSQVRQGLSFLGQNARVNEGIEELIAIHKICCSSGYVKLAYDDRPEAVRADPSVVRGLEYYTGPVFEAELLIPVKDEKGNPVRFGSVGGGGRYDDLVARFTGQKVPATGFSIGVSRLQAALNLIGRAPAPTPGPVVVTVMDKDQIAAYQKLVQTLREADIRAELYLGNPKKFGRQLEYADKRGAPIAVIQGTTERDAGEVILKDLIEGAKAAAAIKDNKEWKETRPAQVSVKVEKLVEAVREILARPR